MKKKLLSLVLILFACISYAEDNYKIELDNLFNQLKTTSSSITAKEIETKIWDLWTTHPSEESLTDLLAKGSYYMSQKQLTTAHNVFSKAIELDPKWAEAWNKRATVLYLMGNYELSQNDIDEVLKLEKRHFGALSGQGMVQTALKNYQKAIDSYIEAHKVYPAMKTPLMMIEKLKILIQQESI
ncbi:MAG: tetratricopeptide repeat protein [Candidatus Pelagibacter sp. TMED118]|nr:MAG: tetratricopeptide repeat protein [Candidatus Pelagibacter sp. TMED118]